MNIKQKINECVFNIISNAEGVISSHKIAVEIMQSLDDVERDEILLPSLQAQVEKSAKSHTQKTMTGHSGQSMFLYPEFLAIDGGYLPFKKATAKAIVTSMKNRDENELRVIESNQKNRINMSIVLAKMDETGAEFAGDIMNSSAANEEQLELAEAA